MGNTRDTQYSRDAQAHADQLAAPSRSLTTKTVVLAAVLALIAAVAFVGAMGRDANAYIPYSANENGNGGKPMVAAKMLEPQALPENYPSKKAITYKGKVEFKKVEVAAGGTYQVTFTADKNAPFAETQLGKNNLELTNAKLATQDGEPLIVREGNRITYTIIPTGGDIVATFTAKGTIKDSVGEAEVIHGTARGQFVPTKKISLNKEGDPEFKSPFQCTGTGKFKYSLPEGGYLMDIKFADAQGNGINLSDEAITDDLQSDNYIIVRDSSGEPIEGILNAGSYLRPDTTPPFYGSADPLVAKYTDARWIDSYNWKYDPSMSTGDTWIPAGSTIEIKRKFTFENCLAGFATDGNFVRDNAFIAVVEIGKNAVPVSDSASISIVTPGKYTEPATCHNLWDVGGNYVGSENSDVEPPDNGVGYFEGLPNAIKFVETKGLVHNEKGQNQQTHAVAASGKGWLDGKLWYLVKSDARGITLASADLSTPNLVTTEWVTEGGPPAEEVAGALAFDTNGFIYIFAGSGNNPSLWRLDLLGKKKQWEKVIDRVDNRHRHNQVGAVKDMAFDSKNNLMVTSKDPNKDNQIFLIPADQIKKKVNRFDAAVGEIVFKGEKDRNGYVYWGLAYGPDGQLYITESSGFLYRVDTSKFNPELPVEARSYAKPNVEITTVFQRDWTSGDLASCNFGDVYEPKAAFDVQKTAIDPETGEVVAPGSTTSQDHPIKIKEGIVTAEYLVNVRNRSNKAGTPSDIKDSFSLPAGMEIEQIRVSDSASGEEISSTKSADFSIAPGEMKAGQLKSYKVSVTLKIDDLSKVEEYKSPDGCELGKKQIGFFNSVSMEGDSNTEDNHGCIPGEVPPTAKVRLVKEIVDKNGDPISARNTDSIASAFELSLGQAFPGENGSLDVNSLGLHGPGPHVPRSAGDKIYKTVPVGSYQLSEAIADGEEEIARHFDPYGQWECTNEGGTSEVFLNPNSRIIDLKEGDQYSCTVKNTPKAYVDKIPSEKQDNQSNEHVGKPAIVDENGKLVAKYKIRVFTNAPGALPVDSGPILDRFKVPEGLQWDAERVLEGSNKPGLATVKTVKDLARDSVVSEPKTLVSRDQLLEGVELASNVSNLKNTSLDNGEKYRLEFEISIPLKIDETKVAISDGSTEKTTKFAKAYQALNQCKVPDGEDSDQYVKFGGGIMNLTYMNREDTSSSKYWQEDNRACIPVKIDPKWAVEKLAKSSGGSGWSKTGDTLTPTEENGEQKVTAQYRVTVTNTGHIPDTQPVVNDNVTLNGGFKVESMKVERVTFNETGEVTSREDVNASDVDPAPGTESNTVGFKIPAKDGLVNAGDSVEYLVTVVGVRSGEPSGETATNVQKCQDSNGGYQSNLGLHNKVALEGVTDSDGDKNNEACIPVQPSNKKIQVLKFSGGDNPQEIVGAEFVVYPDNGGNPDTSKGSALTVIEEAGKKTHKFESAELVAGKDYWLKETKAPSGNELLPEAVKFRLSSEGVKLYAKNGTDQVDEALGGSFKLDSAENGNAFAIKVYDPRAMELPKSGGMGRWPMVGVGVLLFMLSTLYMMKTSGVSRRRD